MKRRRNILQEMNGCFHDILPKSEIIFLITQYQKNGDEEAKARVILHQQRMVVKIALCFRNFGICVADLVQEGNIGLEEAIRRFDPKRNISFLTYAKPWIKKMIIKHIQDNRRTIRIPAHRQDGTYERRHQIEVENGNGFVKIFSLDTLHGDALCVLEDKKGTRFLKISEEVQKNAEDILNGIKAELVEFFTLVLNLPITKIQRISFYMLYGIWDGSLEMKTLEKVGKAIRKSRESVRKYKIRIWNLIEQQTGYQNEKWLLDIFTSGQMIIELSDDDLDLGDFLQAMLLEEMKSQS